MLNANQPLRTILQTEPYIYYSSAWPSLQCAVLSLLLPRDLYDERSFPNLQKWTTCSPVAMEATRMGCLLIRPLRIRILPPSPARSRSKSRFLSHHRHLPFRSSQVRDELNLSIFFGSPLTFDRYHSGPNPWVRFPRPAHQ